MNNIALDDEGELWGMPWTSNMTPNAQMLAYPHALLSSPGMNRLLALTTSSEGEQKQKSFQIQYPGQSQPSEHLSADPQ